MTAILPSVTIDADRDPPGGAVVWLHGLGADGHDFEPLIPMLRRPDLRFVLPHAPRRPVTINMGFVMPAWYDIRSLERSENRESEEDIRLSARQITALLDREIERGVPAERVALVGFSQGAAMALHVGERYPARLAGLGILSGYLILEDARATEIGEANAQTPALFCHGSDDPLVPVGAGRAAHATLDRDGRDIEWHEYPMEHEVCPEEIEAIRQWLNRVLPPR